MKGTLEVMPDDTMKENLNTLSTTKNTPVEFSVKEVGGNNKDAIQVLVTAGHYYDLDYLTIIGAINWKPEFAWYHCHVREMPNGTIQIFPKGIIEKQPNSNITAC